MFYHDITIKYIMVQNITHKFADNNNNVYNTSPAVATTIELDLLDVLI